MTTPTPRTDAQEGVYQMRRDVLRPTGIVPADFARGLERECERLRAALLDCCERMERARGILSSEGNWGMLDTTTARTALKGK